ncbi:MAG: transcription termination factor NusA [bacterium]
MRSPIYLAIARLASEKDIPEEIIIEALEKSLLSAYHKDFGEFENVHVAFDQENGDFIVWQRKTVVKKVKDPVTEISLEDAKEQESKSKVGDEIEVNTTPAEFGRIAIQTAKQVIIQKIREIEKNYIFQEFMDQKHKLIQGAIIRREGSNLFLDIGKVEGLLPYKEQIPGERYFLGQTLKTVVVEVLQTPKENRVLLSRAHPEFLDRLFEVEVPEILQGSVVIKNIAREPGVRSKIAVTATQEGVDPVGACVGQKGVRIKVINEELGEEKIDIIPFDENLENYIANALSPAQVSHVTIDKERNSATVLVDEKNLSLAIGKRGQNVRLASKLVGLELEIRPTDGGSRE